MDRKNQLLKKPSFGYILVNNNDLTSNNQFNQQRLTNLSPTQHTDNLNTPFSSAGASPSQSPISIKKYQLAPQQTARRIDSYSRKTNNNFLKSLPKTERQKSRIQRIAQLDDAIFELEEMYKKLKLSDQDLLDRAERRDLPYVHQLLRFNSQSQIPPIYSPTQIVKSDEELQQKSRLNRLEQIELKRRPISAFYTEFQRAPPMRRSAIPDLINDDQAIRRLNNLPPKNVSTNLHTPNNLDNTISPSYLKMQAAYANPPNLKHSKKQNIYGHLIADPIVDDLQYRKMNKESMNLPPQPPIGIPVNGNLISRTNNPMNDYLHSSKSNDMAVRRLRKDYSVNQTNPFAGILNRSSSQTAFFAQHDDDDLLPETTNNYLINVKKSLRPTKSIDYNISNIERETELNNNQFNVIENNLKSSNQIFNNRFNINKSSSLSNCLFNQTDNEFNNKNNIKQNEQENKLINKPKNNIYKKQILRDHNEEKLENMLDNMLSNVNNQNKKLNDNKNIDNNQLNQNNQNKKFGQLHKSPTTQFMNPIDQQKNFNKQLFKSRTQGDFINYSPTIIETKNSPSINKLNEQIEQNLEKEDKLNKQSIWPIRKDWSINLNENNSRNVSSNLQQSNLNNSKLSNLQSQNQQHSKQLPNKQYFFMRSSSFDNQNKLNSSPSTKVNEMKNRFESKLNDHNVTQLNKNLNNNRITRKSATQPDLMNYNLLIDKKQKKSSRQLRKPKSSLLNRSLIKSNSYKANDEHIQFTDESEHETSSSSNDDL